MSWLRDSLEVYINGDNSHLRDTVVVDLIVKEYLHDLKHFIFVVGTGWPGRVVAASGGNYHFHISKRDLPANM